MARAIWLARHGSRRDFDDPAWAEDARRPYDPPLSGRGLRESQALAERLVGECVSHLFSSPFLRCVETAAPIAERLGLAIKLELGLCEWLNAEWFSTPPDLLPVAELTQRFPRVDVAYRSRGAARYGESGEEALRRAGETARSLAGEFDGSLAMVGHGASVLGAISALLGTDPREMPDLGYGCLIELVQEHSGWTRGSIFPPRRA